MGRTIYGKRPLWQWILLYIVIGAIIYWGIYYTYRRHGSASSNTNPSAQQTPY